MSSPSHKEIYSLLYQAALQLRIDSIRATSASGSGHPTTCLSAADVVAAIFFHELKYDISNPNSVTSTSQPKVSLLAGGYLKAAAGNYERVCISSENGIYIISPIGNAQQNPQIQSSMAIPSYIEDVEILYKSSPQEKYYAFLAAGNRDFMIVDITDVKNPKILKEIALDGTAYAITLMSGYAYVAADTHIHIIKYE